MKEGKKEKKHFSTSLSSFIDFFISFSCSFIDKKWEPSGIDLKILSQNGEWISKSSNSPKLKDCKFILNYEEFGPLDGMLYFSCKRKLTSDCLVAFDLESYEWSIKGEESDFFAHIFFFPK